MYRSYVQPDQESAEELKHQIEKVFAKHMTYFETDKVFVSPYRYRVARYEMRPGDWTLSVSIAEYVSPSCVPVN